LEITNLTIKIIIERVQNKNKREILLMKNYFKKFIMMFVMALAIIGFGTMQTSVANAATIGQQLVQPESGWNRYNYDSKEITYEGSGWQFDSKWTASYISGYYQPETAKIKFNFTGTKLRILSGLWTSYAKDSTITIDGKSPENYIINNGQCVGAPYLVYEKLGLSNGEHSVEIMKNSYQSYLAINSIDTDGVLKSYNGNVNSTTSGSVVLNVEPEKNQIHLKETVTTNLTIDNIKEIAAEDIRIKYDNTKLKFLSMDEVDGIKLVKSQENDGELRLIVASKGAANVVNSKKTLLKLNFQGIAAGDALVDVTKGKVSDGIELEKDLSDAECGQTTIKIDDTVMKDVNNSGDFTLLDLAIDGRHFSEDPKALTNYNTDIVINDAIDNDDLTKIGEYMIANPNYK
jgi:hypothetical protein